MIGAGVGQPQYRLQAGILAGTGQGSVISPLLASLATTLRSRPEKSVVFAFFDVSPEMGLGGSATAERHARKTMYGQADAGLRLRHKLRSLSPWRPPCPLRRPTRP